MTPPVMDVFRYGAAAAELNDWLFVFGGHDMYADVAPQNGSFDATRVYALNSYQ